MSINNSSIYFGEIPLPKFSTFVVGYNNNPSVGEGQYYILGGSDVRGESLDIIERIDTSSQPFGYINNIDDSLVELPTAKKNMFCSLVNVFDEYLATSPYIYVIGGYTTGHINGYVIIR